MKLLGGIFGWLSVAVKWRAVRCHPSINSSSEVRLLPQQSFPQPTDGVLVKTAVSSKFRLVFLVGLEGSAHHYLVSAFARIMPTGDGSQDYYMKRCELMYENLGIKQAMKMSPFYYGKRIKAARAHMQTLARYASSLPPKGAVAMLCGRNSYPKLGGSEKVFSYIDLGTLANLAEEEGVDLRVIYLKRPAKEMIISTTVHRKFYKYLTVKDGSTKGYMEYMRILFTNIAVMHSFLAGLDSKFVVCHDFDYLGDFDQASSIAEHAAPRKELAEELVISLVEQTPEPSLEKGESLGFGGAEFVVARLQRHLDSFEFMYCRQ